MENGYDNGKWVRQLKANLHLRDFGRREVDRDWRRMHHGVESCCITGHHGHVHLAAVTKAHDTRPSVTRRARQLKRLDLYTPCEILF